MECIHCRACVQVPCCNVHFINDNVFQINTSQGMTGFKQDCCPEALPRKLSLCTWTLLPEFPEVLIVPDTLQDIRSDPDLANPCRYALFPLAMHKYCHNRLPQLCGKGKAAYTSTKAHVSSPMSHNPYCSIPCTKLSLLTTAHHF